ncbi:MAG TPA: hypothetical protein DCF68_06760 [Cyanothece sp. UBA12306]|nr:hypothetical protein [Cyanothece sp. UBA12306]
MGWANLGLKRYIEAKLLLTEAKGLYGDKGAAYCLLAQVLEGQNETKAALEYWNDCIIYGDIRSPEEYLWISAEAARILEVKGEVTIKRKDTQKFCPVNPGMIINLGDLIKLSENAVFKVRCADNKKIK